MAARAAAIALMAIIAAVTAAPLAQRAASTTATDTPVGTPPVGMLPPLARHRRGGYTNVGTGQCYDKTGPAPTAWSDLTALWGPSMSYSSPYDTQAKCAALCDSKPDCMAYSWKKSYTDCQIYEKSANGVTKANIVGARTLDNKVFTLGHQDATCYTKNGNGKQCAGNPATFDAGYGGCSTYAVGHKTQNNAYCAKDINKATGEVAENVCRECGACTTGAAFTCTQEHGIQYGSGGHFAKYKYTNSYAGCMKKCEQNDRCTYFVYSPQYGHGKEDCWLKDDKKYRKKYGNHQATSGKCTRTVSSVL